jgi:hypothetical protein
MFSPSLQRLLNTLEWGVVHTWNLCTSPLTLRNPPQIKAYKISRHKISSIGRKPKLHLLRNCWKVTSVVSLTGDSIIMDKNHAPSPQLGESRLATQSDNQIQLACLPATRGLVDLPVLRFQTIMSTSPLDRKPINSETGKSTNRQTLNS